MNTTIRNRATMLIVAMIVIIAASTSLKASQTGTCGGQTTTIPFDDVLPANVFFCSIAEVYFSALTNGTTPTTYSPANDVTREQMAAFVTRTMDQSLKRGSNRAALDQYWTNQGGSSLALTSLGGGNGPRMVKSDGADLWVASSGNATVSRVRASDGKLLDTWTSATGAHGVLVALGKVFVCGTGSPGHLYQIDPTLAAGAVTTVTNIGNALAVAFDGQHVWTSNQGTGSVSIVTLSPLSVSTVTTGFTNLTGIIYDGTNMWVTDNITGAVDKLRQLNSSGAILQSVDVGADPEFPAFDGTNIWVPNRGSNSVSVVRATGSLAGTVLATLTGNGLNGPWTAAFDGERILVTNIDGSSVSLWKASDLTPIGTFSTGSTLTYGACSDGLNFWIVLAGTDKLARF